MSLPKRSDQIFDLNKIKVLKTAHRLRWIDFTENIYKKAGVQITQRHLLYCIKANSIHTADLTAICQSFNVPIMYFLSSSENQRLAK